MRIAKCLILLILCIIAIAANGQDAPVTAVLVQLRVEKNRVAALTKNNDERRLKILLEDRDKVNQAMINDFTDNFSLWPVYYFMDTNFEKIAAKQFDGVLLTADLKPIAKSPVNSETNYKVVSYGYPNIKTKYGEKTEDSSAYIHDVIWNVEQAFIIKNADLSFQTMYFTLGGNGVYNKRNFPAKYYYRSNEFKLEYLPCARFYQRNPFMHTPQRIMRYK